MPNIRFENRISAAGNTEVIFGPWRGDVLVRSLYWSWIQDATNALQTSPNVSFRSTDGTWLVCWPAGPSGYSGAGERVQVSAFPSAGPSNTFSVETGTRLEALSIAIPIPYNLIIPQRHVIVASMFQGAALDIIGAVQLCLEYGAKEPTRPKPGAPPSSRSNP